jgi:simple sugar transport system permease protein
VIDFVVLALLTIITASTPLVFAAIGEIVVEKAGVLNLGVEGMMIVGAIGAFAVAVTTGDPTLAILAGAASGLVLAFIFGFLTLYLLSNQVATGLALTLFGIGFSALLGNGFVGQTYGGLPHLDIPFLSDLPIVGQLIFGQDVLVYLSVVSAAGVTWFLGRTRWGLAVRAVGENHDAAHSIGFSVTLIRLAAVLFGGAYLSLAHTPLWVENMTAGRGWIALALVVFASWRPWRAFFGAYLFGGITIIQLHAQGFGVDIPSQILSMLPYLATIVVLVLISRDGSRARLNAPACLGRSFHASG